MSTLSVLVTSSGAAPAAAVIKALRAQSRYRVTIGAIDMAAHAVGNCLADWHARVPRASDPEFLPLLLRLCAEHEVRYVFPIIDEELVVWARAKERFAAEGVTVFSNPVACVERARDKRSTAQHCAMHGIRHPRCYALEEARSLPANAFPLFAKPYDGRGSVGARVVEDRADLERYLGAVERPHLQELLRGTELTTDVLVDGDGTLLAAVPKERLEVKSGMATKSVTRDAPRVRAFVEEVVRAFEVRGAANIQVIVRDGEPYLIEVNPKFATSLPLTVAAGVNIPLHLLELARGEFSGSWPMPYRKNLLLLRCWDDYFEPLE